MRTLLFLHLLGAAIWVGGHLVLALGILPGALRRRDPQAIRAFEQVCLWLPFDHWFGATPVARALQLKLLLLAATAALGVHARLRLIPNLDAESLPKLGWHIAAITLVGLCFVAVGQSFRFGGAF